MHNKIRNLPYFMAPYYSKYYLEDVLSKITEKIDCNGSLEKSTKYIMSGMCGNDLHKRKLLHSIVGGLRKRDLSRMNCYSDFELILYNWIMQLKAGDIVSGTGAFRNTELEIISVTPCVDKGWHSFYFWRAKNGYKGRRLFEFAISVKILKNYNSHLPNGAEFAAGHTYSYLSSGHIFPTCYGEHNVEGNLTFCDLNGYTKSNHEKHYTNSDEYVAFVNSQPT